MLRKWGNKLLNWGKKQGNEPRPTAGVHIDRVEGIEQIHAEDDGVNYEETKEPPVEWDSGRASQIAYQRKVAEEVRHKLAMHENEQRELMALMDRLSNKDLMLQLERTVDHALQIARELMKRAG